MEYIRTLLEQQPLMALFLTIAIGYIVGEVSIRGFSLGVGAVLFVALAMGWFAPKAAPAPKQRRDDEQRRADGLGHRQLEGEGERQEVVDIEGSDTAGLTTPSGLSGAHKGSRENLVIVT